MFIISLTYLKANSVVDDQLEAHRAYLDAYYEKGVFVASGPKVPRDGGVILANGVSRAELETIAQEDPFFQHGLSKYEITEFIPVKTNEALASVRTEAETYLNAREI